MRRFLLALFFLFFLLLTSYVLGLKSYVFADSQSALSDYNKQYDLYRQNYSSYVTSKNKWLTYRTLDSNQEALTNGRIFLKQRETVVLSYLNMLEQRANEANGLSGNDRDLVSSKIHVEKTWITDHLAKYDSAATLADLESLSGQFEDRYTGVVQYVALQTAGEILSAKEAYLDSLLNSIINRIDQILPAVSSQGQDITIAQRWLLQAKNKNELAGSKQNDAISGISGLQGDNPRKQYNSAVFSLTESNQYLIETASYLKEVLKNITGQ